MFLMPLQASELHRPEFAFLNLQSGRQLRSQSIAQASAYSRVKLSVADVFTSPAPGDTIYVDDTVDFRGVQLKDWFYPQQMEGFVLGSGTVSSDYYMMDGLRYSTEQRNMAGFGGLFRISHLSGLNEVQNVFRLNSEFVLNCMYRHSVNQYQGGFDGISNYDPSRNMYYSTSISGSTRFKELFLMPEYRMMARFSNFKPGHEKLGLEVSAGIGYVLSSVHSFSADLTEYRSYYLYNPSTGYQYQFSEQGQVTNPPTVMEWLTKAYATARAGVYYKSGDKWKFLMGLQINSPELGNETIDFVCRINYQLATRNSGDERFQFKKLNK